MKKNHDPLISVVMSVYNGERYLSEAIDSILSQTFTDFEFIIIDDGSTDTSAEIVHSYEDERVSLIRQKNTGLAAALNKGIELAKGEYIARMDADDVSLPERLEVQVDYLKRHPDVIALGSAADCMDENGNFVFSMVPVCTDIDIKKKLPATPFIHPSVIFLKRYFFDAGCYPENLNFAPEDTVLFNKMSKLGNFANISRPLIRYRLTPQSLSGRNRINQKLMDRIVSKALDGSPISEDDSLELEMAAKKVSPQMKKAAYHSLLSRKYLWNNPDSKKARSHAIKSITSFPFRLTSYFLFFASLLPNRLVMLIYRSRRN